MFATSLTNTPATILDLMVRDGLERYLGDMFDRTKFVVTAADGGGYLVSKGHWNPTITTHPTAEEVFAAHPEIGSFCKERASTPYWEDRLTVAIAEAAKEAGHNVSAMECQPITVDNTWGDRVGLVFFGASEDANKWAASFAEDWIARNGERLNIFGGYERQRSVGTHGPRYKCTYDDGTTGEWSRDNVAPSYSSYKVVSYVTGYTVSHTYYPCAD